MINFNKPASNSGIPVIGSDNAIEYILELQCEIGAIQNELDNLILKLDRFLPPELRDN